jgi:hypothetical protein
MRTYFQGDLVNYSGERHRGDLGGKPGEICAPVVNQDDTYIVAFGSDDYVMSASLLTPFQGHLRTSDDKQSDKKDKKEKKTPKVEARRGKNKQQESDDTE